MHCSTWLLTTQIGSPDAKAAAANAVLNLACNEANHTLIAEAGGIEPLVRLLSDGSPEAKAAAAKALFSLACNSTMGR